MKSGARGLALHNVHRLQLRLLARLIRAGRSARKPPLHLLTRNRVRRRWRSHLNVEDRCRADLLDPGIFVEAADAQDRSLIERFRLDLHAVSDAPRVLEADDARPERHAQSA